MKEKVQTLFEIIDSTLGRKRTKLKEMQPLTVSLAFCAIAIPSVRAFIRRMYTSMSGINKPLHHIRLLNCITDLRMWHQFLSECNDISYMQDKVWVSAYSLRLKTVTAEGSALRCGVYFDGHWLHLAWHEQWSKTDILRDITCLELIPIALSVCLWKRSTKARRFQFSCDNIEVVHILNSKTATASCQSHS